MASCGWIVETVARGDTRPESLMDDNRRSIEALPDGFTTLWFDDHFQKAHAPVFESWTTLTYLAAQYPRLNIGSVVLCQSYRNPAMLAKMAATLQGLTGGRYVCGIGAGWKEDEYRAYGFPFPPLKTRLDQLEEVAQILKLMWSRSPASFQGAHYQVTDAECEPLPTPPPPLLIGGGGEKRTLRIVAAHADWMNLAFADPPTYAHKLEVLGQHCRTVGRDPAGIRKSLWAYVDFSARGVSASPMAGGRFVLTGAPAEVHALLRRYLDLGVDHFMLRFLDFPRLDGLKRFCDEILPHL